MGRAWWAGGGMRGCVWDLVLSFLFSVGVYWGVGACGPPEEGGDFDAFLVEGTGQGRVQF